MNAFEKLSKKAIDAQTKAQGLKATRDQRVTANVGALSEADAKRMLAALLSPETLFTENDGQSTVLERAMDDGDENLAAFLVKQEPRLLMTEDSARMWPLDKAVEEGRLGLCEKFLEVFRDNQAEFADKPELGRFVVKSALRLAIDKSDEKAMALLLPFWSDIQSADTDDVHERPLGRAAGAGQWKAFAQILDHSSAEEINHCDRDDGETIAHYLLAIAGHSPLSTESQALWSKNTDAKAAEKNRKEAKKAFAALAQRPDWDAENIEIPRQKRIRGKSPLLAAIGTENPEAVRSLILKTDVNAPRSVMGKKMWDRREPMETHTPLSYAIVTGNSEAFAALLPLSRESLHKKNIEWEGRAEKFTSLDVALKMKAWDCVVLLARELIETGKLSTNGQEAVEEAVQYQTSSLSKKLRDYKEQFAAAREAFEIRAVIEKTNKKATVKADGATQAGAAQAATKPKTMRL